MLRGNWVDLFIIFILLFYLWEGVARGFLLGTIDLLGFVLSFVVSLKFYSRVGQLLVFNFSLTKGIADALGFLILGFVTEFLFSLAVNFFYRKLYPLIFRKFANEHTRKNLSLLNKIGGILPAVGEAIIFTAFILSLLIALPIKGRIKKDIVSSRIGAVLVSKTQGIEKKLNDIFGEAVSETLNFLTVNPNPQSEESIDLQFTQKNVKIDEAAEQVMFESVNEERVKSGLGKLSFSYELRDVARKHAQDMFARGYFSHYSPEGQSPFDRMKDRKISFLSAGENLALAPNVNLAHQGLMNSPGHRANILSADFGKVGIGVIDGGIYGEMFVQEFTN